MADRIKGTCTICGEFEVPAAEQIIIRDGHDLVLIFWCPDRHERRMKLDEPGFKAAILSTGVLVDPDLRPDIPDPHPDLVFPPPGAHGGRVQPPAGERPLRTLDAFRRRLDRFRRRE